MIGDSHLRDITSNDFSFEGNIQIQCRPGSGIAFAEQAVNRINSTHILLRPHIIVLVTGGNDK